jgi:hypothetical protein
MRKYIQEGTIDKYSTDSGAKVDLMSITRNPIICIWNVLKYTFRIWNGRMKEHDIEKIVHYSEMDWTMSNGQMINKDDIVHLNQDYKTESSWGDVRGKMVSMEIGRFLCWLFF